METVRNVFGPPLPLFASLPIILLTLLAVLWACTRLRDATSRFVVVTVWLRLSADALQPLVFKQSPMGLSWNALISVTLVAIGLMMIRPRMLLHKSLIPLLLLLPLGMVGGIMADAVGDAIEATTRLVLLIVLALTVQEALERNGDRLYFALLASFAPLFLFQMAAVALHVVKASEADGSQSIIGGFAGQGAYSLAVAAALFVVVAIRRMSFPLRVAAIALCVVTLLLANYRTTLIACVPLLVVGIIVRAMTIVPRSQRGIVVTGAMIAMCALFAVAAPQLASRFESGQSNSGISTVIGRDPDQFDREDRKVLSGRAYIWSLYIRGWNEAPGHAKILGSGAGHRPDGVMLYAHNSFISALYEYGVAGLILFIGMTVGFLLVALRVRESNKFAMLAGQAMTLILHFGTLPLWNVEGIILFGLVIGATLHAAEVKVPRSSSRATREDNGAIDGMMDTPVLSR